MSRRRRDYPDDDGRTIVDMSGLERTPLLLPRRPKADPPPAEPAAADRPWEDQGVSRETRRGLIGGALAAALLIALAFILGLGLVIGLIVLLGT